MTLPVQELAAVTVFATRLALQPTAEALGLGFTVEFSLMDEPCGALDALTRGFLQDEVARIWEQQRKTVTLLTYSISDKVVMMSRGSAARVVEVLDVPFPRSRRRESLDQYPDYHTLKAELELHLSRETRAIEETRISRGSLVV